jgi:ABC-type antimicrobial peptide transport system permease subunit
MIKNYFTVALRKFRRQKFYSLINLFGLTIGLASVILIMLYVMDELSYDRFHSKADRIYRVVENQYYAGQPVFPVAVTPSPLGPSLAAEFADVEKATRIWTSFLFFEQGEHKFRERGAYVDTTFLDIFSFEMLRGNASSALKELDNVVLTKSLAQKYFGNDNPIGELIKVNGETQARVSGVLKDIPENSHYKCDFLMSIEGPLARNPDMATNWGNNQMYTYVLLKPDVAIEPFNEQIKEQIKKNNEGSVTDLYLQPLTDIHLGSVNFTADVGGKGNMQYVSVFLLVAIFILVIACINFMNLATARSLSRSKEVGLRKSIGANRYQLILQFLSESVFTAFIAMALAVLLVDLFVRVLCAYRFDCGKLPCILLVIISTC